MILRCAALALLLTELTACTLFGQDGYFRSRAHDYLKSESAEAITLPEGSDLVLEPLYKIPEISKDAIYQSPEDFELPRPRVLHQQQVERLVDYQQFGGHAWIAINRPPSEVWPQVRNFLRDNDLFLVYTNAANGVLETSWLHLDQVPDYKLKFRLGLEYGIAPESTEIHLRNLRLPKSVPGKGQVNWPSQSMDLAADKWLADALQAYLAAQADQATASFSAQELDIRPKVELDFSKREPYMLLRLDSQRAWHSLSRALQADPKTFVWGEADQDLGIIYFDVPNEELGWFSGMLNSQQPPAHLSFEALISGLPTSLLSATDKLPESYLDNEDHSDGFLLFFRIEEGQLRVYLRGVKGEIPSPKLSRELLRKLREQLS